VLTRRVLRTVYDDESDALFHPTVDKLRRWMVEYWLHYGRISGFGEEAQASAEKMSNGSVNEALGERLRFEIVEDKDRLDVPDPEKATVDEIQVLCDRFHEWVAGVGEDPEAQPPASPRLCSFLAIDAKALADLASVPDEIPPLQVAVDFEEFIRRRYSAMYNGWAWIVDPRAVRRYREGVDLDPKHRGWMRIDPGLICSAWFLLVWLLMKGDGDGMIEGHENPKGSGRIFYSVSVF
jgi:hypothetical protein